jgi:hypothetical protein
VIGRHHKDFWAVMEGPRGASQTEKETQLSKEVSEEVNRLSQELADVKQEIASLKEHIMCSPGGPAYFEAQRSFISRQHRNQ